MSSNHTETWKKRRDQMLRLRAKELSYKDIGDILGISKQRVHQFLKDYVSNGDVPDSEYKCVKCGKTENLQCHHKNFDSYDGRKSNLEWLCVKCHRKKHKKLKKDKKKITVTIKPKTKYMNFRWNDIDYEYVIRQAKKLGISRSEYLRRLILRDRKNKALRLKAFEKPLCDRCEKEEATENLDFEDCNGAGSVYVCAKCKEKLEERV